MRWVTYRGRREDNRIMEYTRPASISSHLISPRLLSSHPKRRRRRSIVEFPSSPSLWYQSLQSIFSLPPASCEVRWVMLSRLLGTIGPLTASSQDSKGELLFNPCYHCHLSNWNSFLYSLISHPFFFKWRCSYTSKTSDLDCSELRFDVLLGGVSHDHLWWAICLNDMNVV